MGLKSGYILEEKGRKELVCIACLSTLKERVVQAASRSKKHSLLTNEEKRWDCDCDLTLLLLPAGPSVDVCFIAA